MEPATDHYLPATVDYYYAPQTQYPNGYNDLLYTNGPDYVMNLDNTPLIGEDYMQHAEACGYNVYVGEFYITRQDGEVFQ